MTQKRVHWKLDELDEVILPQIRYMPEGQFKKFMRELEEGKWERTAMTDHWRRRTSAKKQGEVPLKNGTRLFWYANAVEGRTYYTDENGIDMVVWDTALVRATTLKTALEIEKIIETPRTPPPRPTP